jgi:SMI1/KNR4 family protein SUKH-1
MTPPAGMSVHDSLLDPYEAADDCQTHLVPESTDGNPRYRAAPPVPATKFVEVEAALGTLLPNPLVSLYRANDGVFDLHGQWWLIWPVARMVEAKAWLTEFDGYLDRWIPFGDDGTGDPFCFHREDEAITRLSMIDGTHEPFAHGLADFWTMATTIDPEDQS